MDEAHLVAALRYVALNPVRARLVNKAHDWPWSSTRAHLAGHDDHYVTVAPALERVGDFATFLGQDFDEQMTYAALRKAEAVGRPVGVTVTGAITPKLIVLSRARPVAIIEWRSGE